MEDDAANVLMQQGDPSSATVSPILQQLWERLLEASRGDDHAAFLALLSRYSWLIQYRGPGGHTLLWFALKEGRIRVAEALLSHGAASEMLCAKTDAGRSLLQACVDGNRADAAAWLLDTWRAHTGRPIDVLLEDRTSTGYTALWWCGMDGQEEAGGTLLARGADDWATDRNGIGCLAIAVQRKAWGMVCHYREAERAYWWARARRLLEADRASLTWDAQDPQKEGEDKLRDVVAFATQRLPTDLGIELELWMR